MTAIHYPYQLFGRENSVGRGGNKRHTMQRVKRQSWQRADKNVTFIFQLTEPLQTICILTEPKERSCIL